MSQENVEVVRRSFELWRNRWIGEWVETLAPGIEWDISAHPLPDFPNRGSGRDAFVRDLGTYLRGWNDYEAEMKELIDREDEVVLIQHERARKRDRREEEGGGGRRGGRRQENVEVVRRSFELWRNRWIGEWIETLAPGIEWDISAHPLPDFPNRGSGRDAFVRYLGTYLRGWNDYEAEIKELIDREDEVVLIQHERARKRDTEMMLDRDLPLVWTVRDGHLVRFRVFKTRAEALEAAGLPHAMGGDLAKIKPGVVIKRNRWPVKLKPMRWSLRSHGRLTRQPAGKGEAPDSYSYPIPGPTVNDYTVSGNDQWKHDPPSKTGSVAYTTAPLRKTLTFYGSGSLNLWVSSTAPDADIQATVTEVRPGGREQYVQRGWLRLSERAQDKKYSTPLRPFQKRTRSAVAPLTNDKPVRAHLEITRFSQIFRRGSSIRVWLDTPSRTGEMGFKDPTQPSTIRIYHNANHQSQLVLGRLQRGDIDTPQPACDSALRQPCRDNPIPVPGR